MTKIALLFLCFFQSMGFAEYSQEPTKIVTKIYKMLHNYRNNAPGAAAKKKEINQYWMFQSISMDAVQDKWSQFNPKEKTRYLILMKKLLEKTIYEDTGDKLKRGYAVIQRQDNITDKRAVVRSKITVKKNNLNVKNDYGLQKVENQWKIRDIYIDGQNLAEDYRSQYNKIINQYGISGTKNSLLERIEKSISKKSDWYNFSDDDKDSSKSASQDNAPHKTRPSLVQ